MQYQGTMMLDLDNTDSGLQGRAALTIYSDYFFHIVGGQGAKIPMHEVLHQLYEGTDISYSEEKMKERGITHINIIDIANDWEGRLGGAKDDEAMVYELVKRGELFISSDGEYFFELELLDDEEFIEMIDYYLENYFEEALGDSLFLTDTASMKMDSFDKMRYAFKYQIDPDEFNPEHYMSVTHVGVFVVEQASKFERFLES